MRKDTKKTLTSLAVCAMLCTATVGAISLIQPDNEAIRVSAATSIFETKEGFKIMDGAAIRIVEPNGMRFETRISESMKEELESELVSDVTYGTLLLPADFLGSAELTHATASVVDVKTKSWQENLEQNGETIYRYTSVLAGGKNSNGEYTNLPASYYNRPIAARSYVTGLDEEGNKITYYSENTAIRSIGYVAKMAQLSGQDSDLLTEIVSKTQFELVFNDEEQISALKSTESGTAIVSNKLKKSTDNAACFSIGGVLVPISYLNEQYNANITIEYTSTDSNTISVSDTTLTAEKEGTATVTARASFGDKTYTASKMMSTSAYVPSTQYKILISEAAASALLNSQTTYVPAKTEDAYNAYYNAFEKTAAYKMQQIIAEATGVELEIVTERKDGEKYISIGETSLAENVDVSTLEKATASKVKVVGDNIIIRGVTQMGTLYGVQELLGDLVGYEYFMENTYSVNEQVEVVLSENEKSYIPDIEYNVTQSYEESNGVMDDYAMQIYTQNIIPLGTTDAEDNTASYYKGVGHNAILVVKGVEGINIQNTTGTYGVGSYAKIYGEKYSNRSGDAYQKWFATHSEKISYISSDTTYFYREDSSSSTGYIMAELCYTAHGDGTAKQAMVEAVASQMYAKMQKFPTLDRIGFSQADHRIWCECSNCTDQGNPADNLLAFLLDVAANLKTKLTEAGDARASTFKISTLFYHATLQPPKNYNTTYKTAYDTYMQHIEVWLAESGADYTVPFAQGASTWNNVIYNYINTWKNIAKNDVLLWVYYADVTSFFIPFDSFDAIRGNYALAESAGIDYVFNQMMGSKQNWSRFKQFLMSKLAWNATPLNDEWNAWYDEYFTGAYGAGATNMRKYFDAWNTLTDGATYKDAFIRKDDLEDSSGNLIYDGDTVNASIGIDTRTSSYFTVDTLTGWIESIDAAIESLDVNNPKYEIYYRNIMLEKLTPMYLLMYIFDGYSDGSFTSTTYVNQYGAEFLAWIDEWGIVYEGEGESRRISTFLAAIENKGVTSGGVADKKWVEETQFVVKGSGAVIENAALLDGTYTLSGAVSGTATATNGAVTFNASALTVGESYAITFTNNSTGASITFTDVVVIEDKLVGSDSIEGENSYYVVDKTYFVEYGETEVWLTSNAITAGKYSVTVNGSVVSSTVHKDGKIKVNVGTLPVGKSCQVLCEDENGNTVVFAVRSAKFIRTAEEFFALGVDPVEAKTVGKDVTGYYVLANDIDCADKVFISGTSVSSYFSATLDGNGHTVSNVTVNQGGIFGVMKNATVKNIRFENVVYDDGNKSFVDAEGNTVVANTWGNYTALFAYNATRTTFQNIEISVKQAHSKITNYELIEGLFVARQQTYNVFANITVNAHNLALGTLFGSEIEEATYNNVVINTNTYAATGYQPKIQNVGTYTEGDYLGTEYKQTCTDTTNNKWTTDRDANNKCVQNTDALIPVDQLVGVTINTGMTRTFQITNTETVIGAGESITITTNQNEYGYTYTFAESVAGVSVENGVIIVAEGVDVGTTFKVYVKEDAEGWTEEIAFVVAKTLSETEEINLNIGYNNGALVMSGDSVKLNVSELDNIVSIDSLTWNGAEIENATYENGKISIPVSAFGTAYGEQFLVASVTTESGKKTVVIPVLLITNVIETAEELQNFGHIAKLVGTKQLPTGYFTLGNNIDFSTYNGGVYIPFDKRGSGGVDNSYGWNIGEAYGFAGVFDGCGYTISNMTVGDGVAANNSQYSGFIPVLNVNGIIRNVGFTNAKSNIANIGGFLTAMASGTMENIYVQFTHAVTAAHGVLFRTNRTNADDGYGPTVKDVYVNIEGATYGANNSKIYATSQFYALGGNGKDGTQAMGNYQGAYAVVDNNSSANTNLVPKVVGQDGALAGSVYGVFLGKDALAADSSAQAEMATWDSKYWTIIDGVPVWNTNSSSVMMEEITLEDTAEIDLAIGYASSALVYSDETAVIDISAAGDIVSLYSLTLNGSAMEASIENGNLIIAKSAFAKAYGEQTLVATVYTTKGYKKVNIPVLLITNVIETAEELQNFGHIAKLVGTKKLPTGYFTLGNNIDFSTYNGGVYIPFDKRGSGGVDNSYGWNIGEAYGFAGVFDGCGYTISNMTVGDGVAANNSQYSGFIPVLNVNGIIRNVGFTNAKSNIANIGGFLTAMASGTMENIYVQFTHAVTATHGVLFRTNRTNADDGYGPTIKDVYVNIEGATYGANNSKIYATSQFYALGGNSKDGTQAMGTYQGAYAVVDNHANAAVNLVPKVVGQDGALAGSVYGVFLGKDALAADEAAQAEMATWDTAYWTIVDGVPYWNSIAFTTMENRVTVDGIYAVNGTAVEKADTVALDISEAYDILNGKTVSVRYNEVEIFNGTVSGTSLAISTAQFVESDYNDAEFILAYDGGEVTLPVFIDSRVKLNSSNVANPTALRNIIQSNMSASYVLTSDLNMNGLTLAWIKGDFTGTIDGNGYGIVNTTLASYVANEGGYKPAFIVNNYGTLKNIRFEIADLNTSGGSYDRGLVVCNYGTVSNVYVDFNIATLSTRGDAQTEAMDWMDGAGLVRQNAGTVENSIVRVTRSAGIEVPANWISGLITWNQPSGKVSNSYVITAIDTVDSIQVDSTQKAGVTKVSDWDTMDTKDITAANGFSSVWSVNSDGVVSFGKTPISHLAITDMSPATVSGAPSGTLNVYTGDKEAIGFDANSMVYEYVGAHTTSTSWNNGLLLNLDNADNKAKTVIIRFSLGTALTADTYIHMYGDDTYSNMHMFTISKAGVVSLGTGAKEKYLMSATLFDENGVAPSETLETGKIYILKIYNVTSTQLRFGFGGENAQVYIAGYESLDEEEMLLEFNSEVLPYYQGDASVLGFEQGTTVYTHTSASSWTDRLYLAVADTAADYFEFDFVIDANSSVTGFSIWTYNGRNVNAGNYSLKTNGVSLSANGSGVWQGDRTITIFENGVDVTSSVGAWKTNTVYTVRMSIANVENEATTENAGVTETMNAICINTTAASSTVYYANVRCGYNA